MTDETPFPEMPPSPAEAWAASYDAQTRAGLIQQIREVADKLEREPASTGDLKIMTRSIRELRYAFKIYGQYRDRRKITVFGSARTPVDHPDYQGAIELGRRFAALDWMVVTGAGGGIMEAAHEGAGRPHSMGLNIRLPFEQSSNPVIAGDSKLVTFRYFFTRKLMFAKEVDAIALFPGGFGTMDELFELLTLVQTGKRDLLPIVLVDHRGGSYWKTWLTFIEEHLLLRGLISPSDLSLFHVASSVEAAVREVTQFYKVYHSMRFVREKLVLRLQHEIDDTLLGHLNAEFGDILASGEIERVDPHAHEADNPATLNLPRLRLHFNRRDVGRLRLLVNMLNQSVP